MTGKSRHPIALFFPTPAKLGINPIDVDIINTISPIGPLKNMHIITISPIMLNDNIL